MKKNALLLFLAVGISATSLAQSDYKSAIGGRLGTSYYDLLSFSYKNFISQQGALEFNAGFGSKGYDHDYHATTLTAALTYQHHFEIKPAPGLKWYVGGGMTLYNTFSDHNDYEGFGVGLYPTGGIDYKFSDIPLNLSADIRPTVNIVGPDFYDSYNGNFGIAARYTF